jgi:hypothetical protein
MQVAALAESGFHELFPVLSAGALQLVFAMITQALPAAICLAVLATARSARGLKGANHPARVSVRRSGKERRSRDQGQWRRDPASASGVAAKLNFRSAA